jgi:hypothetical protein
MLCLTSVTANGTMFHATTSKAMVGMLRCTPVENWLQWRQSVVEVMEALVTIYDDTCSRGLVGECHHLTAEPCKPSRKRGWSMVVPDFARWKLFYERSRPAPFSFLPWIFFLLGNHRSTDGQGLETLPLCLTMAYGEDKLRSPTKLLEHQFLWRWGFWSDGELCGSD